MLLGFSWISLDSLVQNGEFQRVTQARSQILFLAPLLAPLKNEDAAMALRKSADPSIMRGMIAALLPFRKKIVTVNHRPRPSDASAIAVDTRKGEQHFPAFRAINPSRKIADMSAWGWLTRASRVMKGEADPLAAFPNLKRLYETVDARPAAARAPALGKDHPFKTADDEEAKRALYSSNYPRAA